jgi:ribosomal protein S18 acetylase RimI-like enzyme
MDVQIKPVTTDSEIEIIAGLAKIIWNDHYADIIGLDQVAYMLGKYQTTKAIKSQIDKEGYEYFLIVSGERAVGYLGIIPRHNELFLSKLYILNFERGKGLGHAGMEFLIAKCKANGSDFITLTVNKNNLDAILAYEKMGFEKYGEVVSDIGSGYVMDDYLMRFRINPRIR